MKLKHKVKDNQENYVTKKVEEISLSKAEMDKTINDLKQNIRLPDDTIVTVNLRRPKIAELPPYVMLFQAVGKLVIKEIKPATISVFWLMINKMQYSNHIGVDQQTMAEETGLSIRSVNSAIQELKTKNMILDYNDAQDKRRNVYMINPHIAWKGKSNVRKDALKKLNPNQLAIKFSPEKQ